MPNEPLLKPKISWVMVLAIVVLAMVASSATTLVVVYRFWPSLTTDFGSSAETSANSDPTAAPTQGLEVMTVGALGRLEPKGEAIALSAPAFMEGARVEQLRVQVADRVQTGEVIAILDSRDRLSAALEQANSQVTVARTRLAQVQAGAKTGAINAQSATIERLEAELQGQILTQEATIASLQAQLNGEKEAQTATIASLQAQLNGEKQAQEATIERLKAELNNAATECDRHESLYQDGAISASLRDSKCLAEATVREQLYEAEANLMRIVTTISEQINQAKATLNLTVNTLSQEINAANATLNRTVTTLEKQQTEARATLDQISEVRSVDVAVAEAELTAALTGVQQAEANLDLAYVRSPKNGQVLKIHTWPGELVGPNGIVELGETDQMYAIAEVYETDIHHIRLGQKATITSAGFRGELHGTVDEVGLQIAKKDVLGTDPAADVDARVVEVKIRLDPADSQTVAGLTNLQVNVVIQISPPSPPQTQP